MSGLIRKKAKVTSGYTEETNEIQNILNQSTTLPNRSHEMLVLRRKDQIQENEEGKNVQSSRLHLLAIARRESLEIEIIEPCIVFHK